MAHITLDIRRYEIADRTILGGISQVINSHDRIAIIGPNGVGKTTLMRIAMGEITAFDGSIENTGSMTLGYLAQIHFDVLDRSVRDELRSAFAEILSVEKDLKIAENDLEHGGDVEKYLALLERFQLLGEYAYEREIDRVSRGLGIFHLLDRSVREVSWGERTKIALAKTLLLSPDFLLLDEPTNFIDLESVEWLEKYLEEDWTGGYMIVSHDREFLDTTCTQVWEMRGASGIEVYHGNYRAYIAEREKAEIRAWKKYEEQNEYIMTQSELVNRFRAGSRAGWAKSREKSLEKIELLEKPFTPFRPTFHFEYSRKPTEKILHIKDAFIGRNEPLFFIRELELRAGERIGIVGPNGAGKSTFLKTILGSIPVLDGGLQFGGANDVAFYSQMHEEIDNNKTVREQCEAMGILGSQERLASLLAPYGYGYADIERKMGEFSGGQRSRFLFAMIGMRPSNVLILDEPTNHLDTDSRETLETALKSYRGTLLFISHDRYFVNSLAQKLWVVDEGEMVVCYGNYADYRLKKERGIDYDISLWNEDGEMALVLEEKLGKAEAKRIAQKFGRGKKRG